VRRKRYRKNDVFYNPILRLHHGIDQEQYLRWKSENLPHLISSCVKKYDSVYAVSHSHPFLNCLYSELYSKGYKLITRKYLNKLDALGLAVWWMDDGNYKDPKRKYRKQCGGSLCVSDRDAEVIQKYFKIVWRIYTTIIYQNQKGHWRCIYFNIDSMNKLIDIISPYVKEIPSMLYKIGINQSEDIVRTL
jgi:hypothetical protein